MTGSLSPAVPAVKRPAWVPEALYPFRDHYLEVGGCRVHYLDEGEGPVLLLLHGAPTWSFLYRELIRTLSARFRCIAPDYPGFGLSTAPAGYGFTPAEHAEVIEQLVRTLDLSDVTLMVQDWGGPIGFWVAERHPQRFRALIIGNTFAWPVNGDWHFEAFSRLMGGPLGGLLIRRFNALVNLLIPAGVRRHKVSPEVMAAYRAPFPTPAARYPTHVLPREILRSRAFLAEVEAGLPRLAQLPALIVWGDRDIAFREVERRHFEWLFPRHRTVVLEGAGHFIQEDAPDEIARAILHWWDADLAR